MAERFQLSIYFPPFPPSRPNWWIWRDPMGPMTVPELQKLLRREVGADKAVVILAAYRKALAQHELKKWLNEVGDDPTGVLASRGT